MAEQENRKDLISALWSGADILRSKMDANEYKDYLLGIVFYKYLSDSFLIKVYDLIYDKKPESLKEALDAYRETIGTLFQQVDHLITLHQRKCDELQKMKKFMLQNMFVQMC